MKNTTYILTVLLLFVTLGSAGGRHHHTYVGSKADTAKFDSTKTNSEQDSAEYDYFIDRDGDGIGDIFQKIFGSGEEEPNTAGKKPDINRNKASKSGVKHKKSHHTRTKSTHKGTKHIRKTKP